MGNRKEQLVTIPIPGTTIALEGVFMAGESDVAEGVVVAAPHPAHGGNMGSPVVNEVAQAARAAGLASLRFNWSGVGASGGVASSDTAAADADYRAALAHLGEAIPGGVVAAGYSFGAATAVRVAASQPRLRGLMLVAPPPVILAADALQNFPGPVLLVAGEIDHLAPAEELGRLADELPCGSFQVIPAADHFFATGLAALGRISAAWFALDRDSRE